MYNAMKQLIENTLYAGFTLTLIDSICLNYKI